MNIYMKFLLALFRVTVRHENLDWFTDFIVKLGGKKNYDTFYRLPY